MRDRAGNITGSEPVVAAIGQMAGSSDQGWVWREPGTPCPEIHKVWDERFDPMFRLQLPREQERAVTFAEAAGRMDEGARTIEMIKTGKL